MYDAPLPGVRCPRLRSDFQHPDCRLLQIPRRGTNTDTRATHVRSEKHVLTTVPRREPDKTLQESTKTVVDSPVHALRSAALCVRRRSARDVITRARNGTRRATRHQNNRRYTYRAGSRWPPNNDAYARRIEIIHTYQTFRLFVIYQGRITRGVRPGSTCRIYCVSRQY